MLRKALALLIVSFMLALPLYAALTGDIEGTVFDPQGAVVPGAKVIVKNIATGVTREFTTNEFGQFAALQLDLGEYQVTVEKQGMKSYSERAVVRSGEKTRISAKMVLGTTQETLEVSGAAPVLDTATSQVNLSIDSAVVTALPNQGRDPVAFAALSPGVVPVTKDNPFLGSGSFNSNGSRGRANNITVDNAVASDISTTGSSGTGTFSLDAVQEVKLITNNFTAEYGRNSGAQVQIITKQGTNNYHGSVYWFHQNGYFNARDYFDDTGEPTPLIQNLYGFTAGGPVIKNKFFLFGHYEGLKIRGAGSSSTASVMTDAEAAGITDPTSLAYFQANGSPSSADGTLTSAAPNKTDQHSWSLRGDLVLRGGKDTMTARYGENPGESVSPGLTFIYTSLPNFGASVTFTDRTVFFGYSSTINPTLVNQFRFQYQRSNPTFPPFNNLQKPYTPEILIGGLDGFGVWNGIPQGRTQNVYSYSDTLSWARGRHSLKFGGDVFRYLGPSVFDANLLGTVTFDDVAAFQAGTPSQWTQRAGSSVRHNRSTDMAWFAQDDFRVTQTLTLNLGFRLETSGGVSELDGILSNLNLNSNAPLGGGGTGALGSLDLGGQAFARTWNPAPRVGFAWNPGNGKFVLRGGYGLAYDFIFWNPITNLRFSAPFMPTITVNDFSGNNSYSNLAAGTSQAQIDANAAIGQFLPTQQNFGSISPVSQDLKNPRNQQWNVGVQYGLTRDFVLKATYVGTRNDRLQVSRQINLVQPSAMVPPATDEADEDARINDFLGVFVNESGAAPVGSPLNDRIDPRFNGVTQLQSIGTSNYNALQFELTKRLTHGLGFDVNYTWGHSIDTVSDSLGVLVNDSAALPDPRNPDANRGNSQFDVRQRFVASFVYQFPFTKHFTGPLGKFLDGWGFSGSLDVHSGFPATILAGTRRSVVSDGLLVGGSTVHANGDPTQFHPAPITTANFPSPCERGVASSASTSASTCLNTSGFPLTQPLLGNPGDSGRNRLVLDNLSNLDFAVLKDTKITEGKSLQFRWEVYNIFNHPNFSGFQNNLQSVFFGTYTSTATNMRQMQASLKFTF
jgi:carboxypeptidase family protein